MMLISGCAQQEDHVAYPGCVRKVSIKNAVFHKEIAP
jgi:hypothetical protein